MNFTEFFYKLSQHCVKAQKKEFKKGDIITSYIAKRRQLFILVNGEADLIRYDLNGNRTIVEHYSKNDLFGEIFYCVTSCTFIRYDMSFISFCFEIFIPDSVR